MLVTLCQTSLLTTAPWQSTSIFVIVVGVFKFPLCILPDPLCNCRLRKKIKNSFESCFFCCHIKRKKKKNCQWSVNILPICPTRRRIFLFWPVNFLFSSGDWIGIFLYILIISGLILMVVKRKKMSFIYWNITKTHFSWIYLMCFFFFFFHCWSSIDSPILLKF